MLPHTITLAPLTGVDEYGAPTFGAAVTYPARVHERLERVVDFDGNETLASTVVWVAPHATSGLPDGLSPRSQITLEDGTTPPILRYSRIPDEDGEHHAKMWLGPTRNRA